MDLQTIRYFKTIADTGSFTAASETLHYAQSNLSTQIIKLETELETKLFYRNKHGVVLTSDGSLFYEYADKILRMTDEAAYALTNRDIARGELRIGSIEATALKDLPGLIGDYHIRYPQVRISLETDLNDFFPAKVINHALDGAFMVGPVRHPGLEEIFIRKEYLMLVGSAAEEAVSAKEILEKKDLITFSDGSAFRYRMELLLSSKSIPYMDRVTKFNSLGAMITNIIAGLGFGYLPRSIAEEYIGRGLMKTYPLEDPYSEIDVVFAYRKDHIMTAAFRSFLEMLQET